MAPISDVSTDSLSQSWPRKVEVFGVRLSVTSYDDIVERIIQAARCDENFVVEFVATDTITQAVESRALADCLNAADASCPDGHPVRIAMNRMHSLNLRDRVCGPDTTERVLQRASETGVPVYFYGTSEEVLYALKTRLENAYPGLIVAGTTPGVYRRPMTEEERSNLIRSINESGARITFVGLGSPAQSHFASEFKGVVNGGIICIGAAFDFLAGSKKRAPRWMQKSGLEWSYRLAQEPRRLWKRYTVRNVKFIYLISCALLGKMLKGPAVQRRD